MEGDSAPTRAMANRFACALGILAVLALAGCASPDAFSGNDKQAVQIVNSPTTLLCAGRFTVSLPTGTTPLFDSTYHYIKAGKPVPGSNFKTVARAVDAKAEKMRSVPMVRDGYADRIYRAAGLDPDAAFGKTQLLGVRTDAARQQILIGFHPKTDRSNVTLKLARVIGHTKYIFTDSASGANGFPSASANLWNNAGRFKAFAPGQIPTRPGFCVNGGMFADGDSNTEPVHENLSLVVYFKDYPDAIFTIDSYANDGVGKEDRTELESRFTGGLSFLMRLSAHIDVLFKGKKEAAGQEGYQVGLQAPSDTDDGQPQYKFFWASTGKPGDANHPEMEVELIIRPGRSKAPTTIASVDAAKALWKKMLDGISIRFDPAAPRGD
jgi:hypothetical protein